MARGGTAMRSTDPNPQPPRLGTGWGQVGDAVVDGIVAYSPNLYTFCAYRGVPKGRGVQVPLKGLRGKKVGGWGLFSKEGEQGTECESPTFPPTFEVGDFTPWSQNRVYEEQQRRMRG